MSSRPSDSIASGLHRSLGVLAILLSAALPVAAQRTTGGVSGTLSDETGAVLPGVRVAVTGPGIVGTQTATTSGQGTYRFMSLPPGTYQLSFALRGFRTVNHAGVRVAVGSTVEENQILALASVGEELTVTADPQVIDASSNEVATSHDRSWIDNAPLGRVSFFDLVALAPGTLQPREGSAATQVFGSSNDENLFQLDGTDITDNFFGAATAQPNIDAIEEVEILSLGAPAEYGNLTGAVYNIVTRQGSNAFHGDVGYYNQSGALTGRNTTPAEECYGDEACLAAGGYPFTRDHYHDFTAQVGGPILKDKLWFFASYQLQRDGFSPLGVEPSLGTQALSSNRYLAKLNWQISPRHKIQANFHLDDATVPGTPGPNVAPSAYATYRSSTPTPGVSYTGTLSDKTTLEVRYSGFYGEAHVDPTDPSQPRDQAHLVDLDTSQVTGGWYYWYDLTDKRSTVAAKVSHYSDNFLGARHDFRFGVQYSQAEASGVYGQNDLIYTYQSAGQTFGYGNARQPFSYSGNTEGIGAYLDDTVKTGRRLSLTLGLRYDHNAAFSKEQQELDELGNPTGVHYPRTDYYTWKHWSPRIGFSLLLTGDGKTALKGHYGRYHRGIATAEFANIVGPSIKPIYYGAYDAARGELVDLVQVSSNQNLSIDPDYESPYTDQYILSFERELLANLRVNADYLHKSGRNFGAWQDYGGVYEPFVYVDDRGIDATGNLIVLQQLQNSRNALSFAITNRSEMRTDVDAVSVGFLRRRTGRWQLNASVTWMRSSGRLASSLSAATSFQRGGLQFNPFGRDPNDFVNTGGRLAGDTPWTAKAQFLYQLPADFVFSLSYRYRSGANLVRGVRVEDTHLSSIVLAQERGSYGRLPDASFVDVRLSKDFKLRGDARLGLAMDCFNLLNNGVYEGVQSGFSTSSAFGVPADFVRPRRLMLGAKLKF